jgi:HEPN domain-containing protein
MNRSREYARGLLDKARGDSFALERLVDLPEAPLWILGFHAQQAVEKAMKAVLASRGIEYPSTHNLASLTTLLHDHGIALPPDSEQLPRLTPFGVAFRYDTEPVDEQRAPLDRTWIKDSTGRTMVWAEQLLNAADSTRE